ncbi:MAG: hypothetical protein R2939_13725 [Kofleriaceae bacterium]
MSSRTSLVAAALLVGALGAACDAGAPSAAPSPSPVAPPLALDAAPPLPPHQRHVDLAAAVLASIPAEARVLGFGELHVRADRPTTATSALARFQAEVLPALAPRLSDLVLETWIVDRRCAAKGTAASARIEQAMHRPDATKAELANQIAAAQLAGVKVHALTMACDDYDRVAPPTGGIDAEALLTLVTRELGRIAQSAIAFRDRDPASRPWIAVYGGALHNDRTPLSSLAEWSYAADVDAASGGRFVELDLIVPELAEADPASRQQPWFPLVAGVGASPVSWQRGERSVVIILPRATMPPPLSQ